MSPLEHAQALVAAVCDRQVQDAVDAEAAARWERRERRRPLGCGRSHPPTCPACHRFVSNVSAPCGCGWDPANGWGA